MLSLKAPIHSIYLEREKKEEKYIRKCFVLLLCVGGARALSVGGRGIYKKDDGGFYGRAPGIIVKRIDGLYILYYYNVIYNSRRLLLLLLLTFSYYYYQRII
jgi:hypothetical protein